MEAVKRASGNYLTESKAEEPHSKADNNRNNQIIETELPHTWIIQTHNETSQGNHKDNPKSKHGYTCSIMVNSSFLFVSHSINPLIVTVNNLHVLLIIYQFVIKNHLNLTFLSFSVIVLYDAVTMYEIIREQQETSIM